MKPFNPYPRRPAMTARAFHCIVVLICIGVLIALSGCATKPEERIVEKTVYIQVIIPKTLLTKCPVTAPPKRDLYIASSFTDKEEMQTDYITHLLGDIKSCSDRIVIIDQYQEKQIKLIKDSTP